MSSSNSDSEDDESDETDETEEEEEEEFREDMRVFLRLRPMNKLETSRRSKNCIDLSEDPSIVTVDSPLEGEFDFTFDHVRQHLSHLFNTTIHSVTTSKYIIVDVVVVVVIDGTILSFPVE